MAHHKHEVRYPLYCTACCGNTPHVDHESYTECVRCGAHGFWLTPPTKQGQITQVNGSNSSRADGRP